MKKAIKPKYKTPMQKAALGLQKVEVPQAMGFGDVMGSSLGLGSSLGQLGSSFGPWGTAIGAGVGMLGGLFKGLVDQKRNRIARRQAELNNKYYDSMSAYDINPSVYADDDRPAPTYKKGTKGIRVKYKASVKTKTPSPKDLDAYSMFSSAPSEKGLSINMYGSKKVPKYKK